MQERLTQQRKKPKNAKLFVLKRELGDFPHLHQALFPNTGKVKGRKVVLLRAAATTSEELRSLVALLAGEKVKSIHVICLVNRMGPYTVSFVRRIQRLVCGGEGSTKCARFDFVPLYSLMDVRTDDLITMHRRVADVLDKYARSTEVPFFKMLDQEYRLKMTPVSTTTCRFEQAEDIDLTLKVAEVIEELSKHRTGKLIDLIADEMLPAEQAEVYLLVTGLIISDIDYFRLSRTLMPVIRAMRKRMTALQDRRFKLEVDRSSTYEPTGRLRNPHCAIADLLSLETHVLFALALLSHFDKHELTNEEIVEDTLFAGLTNEQWGRYPVNLRYHFREGHYYWLTAFLLNGVHPEFFSQPAGAESRLKLAKTVRDRIENLVGHSAETCPHG